MQSFAVTCHKASICRKSMSCLRQLFHLKCKIQNKDDDQLMRYVRACSSSHGCSGE